MERTDKHANRAVYDELRRDERRRFATEPSKLHTSELLVPWVVSHVSPGNRLLDVAGGAGTFASQIVRRVDVEVVGLDISESMVEQRAEDPRLATNIVGDMEALPFEDESFDAAMFVACLHHVPDPLPALREARRVLRPDGQVFAFEPSSVRARHVGSAPIPDQPHEFRMSGGWLAERLAVAGFQVEELRGRRIAVRALRPVVGAPTLRLLRLGDAVDSVLRRIPAVEQLGEIAMLRARRTD
jgi:SAM-dependent methyltransferase